MTAKISGCNFGSTLPASIGNWTVLELFSAHNNKLTGPLPGTMAQWSRLKTFNVGGNQFTGTLPNGISQWAGAELVCVLKIKCICMNIIIESPVGQLTGIIKFLLCFQLLIGENNFTGSIPTWIGQLTNLIILEVGAISICMETYRSAQSVCLLSLTNFAAPPKQVLRHSTR